MDKSLVFTPGCDYTFVKECYHNVMFVEYETVSGEHKRQRFDLVDPSAHFVIDGHRQAQLSYISNPPEGVKLDIKKVYYREESCWTIIGGKMFIPTRIEFDTVIHVPKESPDVDSDRVKTINQRIARIAANSVYGISSRDWADVLADSARYIYAKQSRCNGKTLWLSSATSFADDPLLELREEYLKAIGREEDEKLGRWFRENGYFDTDMAMTKEEMQYCRNDVAVTEKLFKEEKIMRFNSCKPTIKNVIFNDPATIVMWSDGTKTVVKCGENDIYDPEKGVAMCCMKKLLGTNKTGSNYLDKVEEYFDKYDDEQVAKCLDVKQRFMEFLAGCVKNRTDPKDIPPEETVEKEFEAVISDDWTIAPADENTTAEENGE